MRSPSNFNPRSRMGSDTRSPRSANGSADFNPRSRMGSDTNGQAYGYDAYLFQSTLPHGERPRNSSRWTYPDDFNPRSRMGSDDTALEMTLTTVLFQSTLPHGERRAAARGPAAREISIHAPAWGATWINGQQVNHTGFQSTLPHGERPGRWSRRARNTDFNPCSRMGSDHRITAQLHQHPISIHAPAWGATDGRVRA